MAVFGILLTSVASSLSAPPDPRDTKVVEEATLSAVLTPSVHTQLSFRDAAHFPTSGL